MSQNLAESLRRGSLSEPTGRAIAAGLSGNDRPPARHAARRPRREARVLELGCAAGQNLVPLAERYPEATFLGIDISGNQIEVAQRVAAGALADEHRVSPARLAGLGRRRWARSTTSLPTASTPGSMRAGARQTAGHVPRATGAARRGLCQLQDAIPAGGYTTCFAT